MEAICAKITPEEQDLLNAIDRDRWPMDMVYDRFGKTPGEVRKLLSRPDVMALRDDFYANVDEELRALRTGQLKGLRKIVDGFTSDEPTVSDRTFLGGSDQINRMTGAYKDNLNIRMGESAEDKARRLLAGEGEEESSGDDEFPDLGPDDDGTM